MSLTHDHGNIVFTCDGKGCGSYLETDTSNFDAARNVLKRNRWKPHRRNETSDWQHACPDCQAPLLRNGARLTG
ncbi:MAG: hypothetical protein GEU91_18610 [Rhizobiales bacterium]|nr:hypothetical protein [Hyphomicrobiales bacterium]